MDKVKGGAQNAFLIPGKGTDWSNVSSSSSFSFIFWKLHISAISI